MRVLFVCTENAGRSQIAEHLFNASAARPKALTDDLIEWAARVVALLAGMGVSAGPATPSTT